MKSKRITTIALVSAVILAVMTAVPVSAQGDPCTFQELLKKATDNVGVLATMPLTSRGFVVSQFRLTITDGNLGTANRILGLNSTLESIGKDAAAKYGATSVLTRDGQGVYISFDEGGFRNPCGGNSGGLTAQNPVAEPVTGQAGALNSLGVVNQPDLTVTGNLLAFGLIAAGILLAALRARLRRITT